MYFSSTVSLLMKTMLYMQVEISKPNVRCKMSCTYCLSTQALSFHPFTSKIISSFL